MFYISGLWTLNYYIILNSCFSSLQFTDYSKCYRNICLYRWHTINKSDFLIMSVTIMTSFYSLIVCSTNSAFWCTRSSMVRHQSKFGNFSNLPVKWIASPTWGCTPLTIAPTLKCALGQNSWNEHSVFPAHRPGMHSQLNWDWSSAKIPSSNVLDLLF